jgi:predicted kinase
MTESERTILTSDLAKHHWPDCSKTMILVGGLPGAGKTYFSLRLSDRLGAAYINSDVSRTQIEAQGGYAFDDKLNVYEEMARRAGKELGERKSVIVDATFYCYEMREIFFTLAKLRHAKPVFIEIVAAEKVILKRLAKLVLPRAAGVSVYNLVKSQYEKPDMDRLVIESKDDNIEEMLVRAIDYISKVAYCKGH